MDNRDFSIKEAYQFGWAMTKEKFFLLASLLLLTMALSSLTDISERGDIVSVIVTAAAFVMSFVVSAGIVGIFLKLYDGKEASIANVFDEYAITFRYFVAELIFAIVTMGLPTVCYFLGRTGSHIPFFSSFGGFLVFFVLGAYIALRLQFYNYILVDKHVGIVESFRQSARITQGQSVKLIGFWIVWIMMNTLGALVFFIGLFISVPVSMLALVYVYRKLSSPAVREDAQKENDSEKVVDMDPTDIKEPDIVHPTSISENLDKE